MNLAEATEVCERWFAHLDRQRERAKRAAELARMARDGQAAKERAQRLLREMDAVTRTVYDAANLEPAVKFLLKLARHSSGNGEGQ